jgi:hypothetical protein
MERLSIVLGDWLRDTVWWGDERESLMITLLGLNNAADLFKGFSFAWSLMEVLKEL